MDSDLLSKKLLIVEDEQLMRSLLLHILKKIGFKQVYAVENAEAALKKKQYWQTDLIMTDIELGGLSGLEMIRAIRCGDTIFPDNTPIIVLTGLSEISVLVQAAELHVQGFLTKPVSAELLEERLKGALSGTLELNYKKPSLQIPENSPLRNISLNAPAENTVSVNSAASIIEEVPEVAAGTPVDLAELSIGMQLKEDIQARGHVLLKKGTLMQGGHLKVVNDMRAVIDNKQVLVKIPEEETC